MKRFAIFSGILAMAAPLATGTNLNLGFRSGTAKSISAYPYDHLKCARPVWQGCCHSGLQPGRHYQVHGNGHHRRFYSRHRRDRARHSPEDTYDFLILPNFPTATFTSTSVAKVGQWADCERQPHASWRHQARDVNSGRTQRPGSRDGSQTALRVFRRRRPSAARPSALAPNFLRQRWATKSS